MKKLVALSVFAMFANCGSSLEPPNTNNDYKNIIGNPIKVDSISVAQYDFPKAMNWSDATKACEALGIGWRLPNQDELNILYQNKSKIGGFLSVKYWTSTEFEYLTAWTQSFLNGKPEIKDESEKYSVRAIYSEKYLKNVHVSGGSNVVDSGSPKSIQDTKTLDKF
jgi:hypothetical protein